MEQIDRIIIVEHVRSNANSFKKENEITDYISKGLGTGKFKKVETAVPYVEIYQNTAPKFREEATLVYVVRGDDILRVYSPDKPLVR